MKTLRLIADVHSKQKEHLKVIGGSEYSISLGDVGFDYSYLDKVDSDKHKFFCGNHDNYDSKQNYPHWLGDYGVFELNSIKGFFIGGAFSIDWQYRTKSELRTGEKTFWTNEQLSIPELRKAVDLYKEVKPDFMLSHTCPTEIAKKIGNPDILRDFGYDPDTFTTNTQEALQECFEYHRPNLWVFGHMHLNINTIIKKTRFICRKELGYTDINENLEVIK